MILNAFAELKSIFNAELKMPKRKPKKKYVLS